MTTYDIEFSGKVHGKLTGITSSKCVWMMKKYSHRLDVDEMKSQMEIYNMITADNAKLVLPFNKDGFVATITFHHK